MEQLDTFDVDMNRTLLRLAARAILISPKGKLVLMKRTKKDSKSYYVTIGGGVDKGESSEQAIIRELKEETGSLIHNPIFAFHNDDFEKGNSVDFYICHEIHREKPTGTEWTKWNTPDNQYEIIEVGPEALSQINLVPEHLKEKIIEVYKKVKK